MVGRVVDQEFVDGDLAARDAGVEDAERRLAEEAAGLAQHVSLVHDRDLAAPVAARVVEREGGDAPAAGSRNDAPGDGRWIVLRPGQLFLARVEALTVLADDDHVDAGALVRQRRRPDRAHTGMEVERPAKSDDG